MCDFKVGDEVTKIDNDPWTFFGRLHRDGPEQGEVYVVDGICVEDGGVYISVARWPGDMWNARRFRKVQRRNLQKWLSQSVGNTDELDKRRKVGA